MNPKMEAILRAALAVAISAPDKPKQYEYHIPTAVVEPLRRALEDLGVDWRAVKKRVDIQRADAGRTVRA